MRSRYTRRVIGRRIAVVGAGGFIGRHLVSRLESLGYSTLILGSADSDTIQSNHFWSDNPVEAIVWLASKITPTIAESDPQLVEMEIAEFSSFLRSAEQGRQKIIFASSGGTVYSGQDCPFNEESPARGVNAYGRAKVQMEMLANQSLLENVNLRIANAYGPGQRIDRGQGVIASWANSVLNEMPIKVFGSLSVSRDFVYIDDVVTAIVNVISAELSEETLNIGSGKATSLNEILDELEKVSRRRIAIQELARRGVDRESMWLDISKAKKLIHWEPKVGFSQGIEMTWNSLQIG